MFFRSIADALPSLPLACRYISLSLWRFFEIIPRILRPRRFFLCVCFLSVLRCRSLVISRCHAAVLGVENNYRFRAVGKLWLIAPRISMFICATSTEAGFSFSFGLQRKQILVLAAWRHMIESYHYYDRWRLLLLELLVFGLCSCPARNYKMSQVFSCRCLMFERVLDFHVPHLVYHP